MSTIAELMVELGLNTAAFKAGINSAKEQAREGSDSIIGTLGRIGKMAVFGGLAAGAVGLVAGMKECVSAAMDNQKAEADLDAVLKSTGDAAAKQAQQWAQVQGKYVQVTAASKDLKTAQANAAKMEKLQDSLAALNARLHDQQAAWDKAKTHTESAKVAMDQTREKIQETQAQIDKLSMASGTATTKLVPLAQAMGLTPPVAQMTREELIKLADAYQLSTLFGKEQVLGGESMLLTFTKIGKDVFPQATEAMLNMAQKMGSDPRSAAIQLGKALQDPVLGMSALRRVGVNFSEDQAKWAKSMVEQGRIVEVQKFILNELQTEFGGVAKAAGDTAAGKIVILGRAFDELKETIGNAFLPIITTGMTKLISLAQWAMPEAEKAAGWLGDELARLTTKGQGVLSFLSELWDPTHGQQLAANLDLPPQTRHSLDETATKAYGIKQALEDLKHGNYGAIMAGFGFPPDMVNSVNSVIGAMRSMQRDMDQVVNWARQNWPLMQQTVGSVFSSLANIWKSTWPVLQSSFESVFPVVLEAIKEAMPIIQQIGQVVAKVVADVAPVVKQVISEAASLIMENMPLIQDTIEKALAIIQIVWDAVWPHAKVVIEDVWDGIKGAVGPAMQTINDIITTVLDILQGHWDEVWDDIKKVALDAWNVIAAPVESVFKTIEDLKKSLGWNTSAPAGQQYVTGGYYVPAHAAGADFIAYTPQVHMFGEAGPERVQITPLGRSSAQAAATINLGGIHIYGNADANTVYRAANAGVKDGLRAAGMIP